ncbi:MAG: RDD family protein [Gammaproteobacteria bacterium]
MQDTELEYVDFWPRVGATLIDMIIIWLVTAPLQYLVYGSAYFTVQSETPVRGIPDFLISFVLPLVGFVLFWLKKQATPGKMVVAARVVDAKTGKTISVGQAVGRYLGYIVAIIPFGLGLLWVVFDRKKQGWHDKMAGTVVVRPRREGEKSEPVRFETPV